jgi:hypothetical protein
MIRERMGQEPWFKSQNPQSKPQGYPCARVACMHLSWPPAWPPWHCQLLPWLFPRNSPCIQVRHVFHSV